MLEVQPTNLAKCPPTNNPAHWARLQDANGWMLGDDNQYAKLSLAECLSNTLTELEATEGLENIRDEWKMLKEKQN